MSTLYRWTILFCATVLVACAAIAHEVRPGVLTMIERHPSTFEVLWKQPVRDGARLRLDLSFPDDCEKTPSTLEPVPGAVIERWTMVCAVDWIGVEGLDRTLTDILVEVRLLDGGSRHGVLRANAPRIDFLGEPHMGVPTFLRLGVEHILNGYDHLLLVLGMVTLVRLHQLVITVTSFTLGHSVTLSLAALGVVALPATPVEIVIALSLVLLGLEAVRRLRGEAGLGSRLPWLIGFGFGLVHGFGFAGALAEIGLPQGEEIWALALFNLGVELGQLVIIAALLAIGWALYLARESMLRPARFGAAYIVGTAGCFWALERSVTAFAELLAQQQGMLAELIRFQFA